MDYRKAIVLGLAAAVTFGAIGYAMQKKDIGMNDIDAGISYAKAEIFGSDTNQPPVATPVVNETVTPTATPEKPFIMYDNIKIIGDEQFQKDVMSLEFGKKYYPEGNLKYTKEIEAVMSADVPEMAAGSGHTFVNASAIHKMIKNGGVKAVRTDIEHEEYHNYASLNDPKNNTEERAIKASGKLWDKLFNQNQSEINNFVKEFNFSEFKK